MFNRLSDIILKLPIKWKKVKFATVYRETESLMVSKSCGKEIKRSGKNTEERKINGVNHACRTECK